jgi:8-oxo-dGTP diphosphatase
MTTPAAKHSVSVAGIVVNEVEQVLLIQRRDNQQWEPPGGILELDESFQDGVVREVREETGVVVEVERLSGVYKNMPKGIVALVFRCRAVSGTPAPSSEAMRVAWVDRRHVTDLLPPAYAIRVLDAFRGDVPSRIHDGHVLIDPDPADKDRQQAVSTQFGR